MNNLFGLDNNRIFIILFFVAVVTILGFIGAAFVTNYKRGTLKEFQEVIKSMFLEPLFWTALGSGLIAAWNLQFDLMFAAFLAFLGYKLIATEMLVLANGDNRFAFFDDSKWNKIAAFVISTKTTILLLGIGIFWLAGYKEIFDASMVSDRAYQLLGAWGAANGIPLLTMLKSKDMSWLNPVPRKLPSVAQMTQYVPPGLPQPTIIPVANPPTTSGITGEPLDPTKNQVVIDNHRYNVINNPPTPNPQPEIVKYTNEETFDDATWDAKATKAAIRDTGVDTDLTHFYAFRGLADSFDQTGAVRTAANLLRFGSSYLSRMKALYKARFGFAWEDREKPESLIGLKGLCNEPVTSYAQFIIYSQNKEVDYKVLNDQCKNVVEQYSILEWVCLNRQATLENNLQSYTPGITFWNAFWSIKEIVPL